MKTITLGHNIYKFNTSSFTEQQCRKAANELFLDELEANSDFNIDHNLVIQELTSMQLDLNNSIADRVGV